MVCVAQFERWLGHADVFCSTTVCVFYSGMVNNFAAEAFTRARAGVLVGASTAASGVIIHRFRRQDLPVMCIDDGVHVWGATIAEFHCLSVYDFVQMVVYGEVFVDKS